MMNIKRRIDINIWEWRLIAVVWVFVMTFSIGSLIFLDMTDAEAAEAVSLTPEPMSTYHNYSRIESIQFDSSSKLSPLSLLTDEDEVVEGYVDVTEADIDLIASIVFLEARGESYECQQEVASVIVNRMIAYNMSAHDVIFDDNQFTTADYAKYVYPSEYMINLVTDVVKNGPTIPEYVVYFRAGKYHEWDTGYNSVQAYMLMDNTYFSYDSNLRDSYLADKMEDK